MEKDHDKSVTPTPRPTIRRPMSRWQIVAVLMLMIATLPAIWIVVRPNKNGRMPRSAPVPVKTIP